MNCSEIDFTLYAVTDRSWLKENETLAQVVETLLKAGVGCVQLREKTLGFDAFVEQAKTLKPICNAYHVPLIINDNVEVCLAADADGVHVGQSDMEVSRARALLGPDKLIGTSAHNVAEALKAQQAGADYLGCGAVFGSTTKTNVSVLDKQELAEICKAVIIPVVAIGGISQENVGRLENTGISGTALVSALFAAEDKTLAAQTMRKAVQAIVHRV